MTYERVFFRQFPSFSISGTKKNRIAAVYFDYGYPINSLPDVEMTDDDTNFVCRLRTLLKKQLHQHGLYHQ